MTKCYQIVYNCGEIYTQGGMHMIDFQVIGFHISYYRKKKGLSQAELAEMISSSVPYISYIETGKKQVGVEYLVRIAEALEVSVDRLLIGNQATDKQGAMEMLQEILRDTTPYEKAVILETARDAKKALRKYSRLNGREEE